MLNFTVGPVQSDERICALGANQVPYFRTPEFSEVMLENERLFLKFAGAPEGSRAVFLTGSGTAGMEAAVMNTLDASDKAIVVDGGSFGHRFVKLLEVHGIEHTAIALEAGSALAEEDLAPFAGAGYTALLINLCETSTGVVYDLGMVADFCRREGLFLIVDAVSAFLTEAIDMAAAEVDVLITGSQKALAVPPGISVLALAPSALERVQRIDPHCMYFDLKDALKNGERGQTPFTPAVGILLQINERLRQIDEMGVQAELDRVAALAADFRRRIADLPFTMFPQAPANAVTALYTGDISAKAIFAELKDNYGMWICPNGGAMAETVFRVGHIGALTPADNEALVNALLDMQSRGLFEPVGN